MRLYRRIGKRMKKPFVHFRDFDKPIKMKIGKPILLGVIAMFACALIAKVLMRTEILKTGVYILLFTVAYGGYYYFMAAADKIVKLDVQIKTVEKDRFLRGTMNYTMMDADNRQMYKTCLRIPRGTEPYKVDEWYAYYVDRMCVEYQQTDEHELIYLSQPITIVREFRNK